MHLLARLERASTVGGLADDVALLDRIAALIFSGHSESSVVERGLRAALGFADHIGHLGGLLAGAYRDGDGAALLEALVGSGRLANDIALFDVGACLLGDGHLEAGVLQRGHRIALRLADNVGHRDLFGTERKHIGDNGALRRLVARLQILRGDLALLDFVVVDRRARLHGEAHLVAELLRLIRCLVRQIGHSDLLGALRDVQVDLRPRGLLRSRCGILAHNAARSNAVIVDGVGGAHLEPGLLDDRRGLLERLALHVGYGVA